MTENLVKLLPAQPLEVLVVKPDNETATNFRLNMFLPDNKFQGISFNSTEK